MADLRERVVAAVDGLAEEVVDFTAELVRLPTVNPPGEGYEECARLIGGRLQRGGFEVEYVSAEGRPEHTRSHPRLNVVGTRAGKGRGPVVHFYGHFDVVPPGDGWTVDPAPMFAATNVANTRPGPSPRPATKKSPALFTRRPIHRPSAISPRE